MQLDQLIDILSGPQQDKSIKILHEGELVEFKVELDGAEVRLIPYTITPF